jgi:hypothetical protein
MAPAAPSGYDRAVVGDDEARARAALVAMQRQLAQGPHIALQVAEMANAAQVRRAFLELTKEFHPARFARMAPELHRLSNEVFLGIKDAHDRMLRALGAPPRPQLSSGQTTQILPVTGGRVPMPAKPPGTQPGVLPARPAAKTPTPALGVPITRPTPAFGVAIPRTLTPGMPRAGSPPLRPSQPMPQRTTGQRPATPNKTTDGLDPGTIRYAGSPPNKVAVFDEQAAFREAVGWLAAESWTQARQSLHALAVRVPQSRQYRALLCYARGREAQAAGKLEDAVLEFQRALQLDPDLSPAKQGLSEVQRR